MFAFVWYAVVNLIVIAAVDLSRGGGGFESESPEAFRLLSGQWMAGYAAFAAVLYSAIVVSQRQ